MDCTKVKWEQSGTIIWAGGEKGAVICQMAEPHPQSGLVEFHPLEIGSKGWDLQMSNANLIKASYKMYQALLIARPYLISVHIPRMDLECIEGAIAEAEGK